MRLAGVLLRRTLLALMVAAAGLGAYLWTGSDRSLGAALDLAARFLPEGQSLETREVTGSLRAGGHIGWLRWRQGELSVEAYDAELTWSLRGLLDGELRLQRLGVRQLRIDDKRPPTPPAPPKSLALPMKVSTPFEVGTLEWAGTPPLSVTGLSGNYVFDSTHHRIDAGKATISAGSYGFSGQVQATDAMALALRLDGELTTTPPGSPHTVTLTATAEVQGTLGGPDAALDVAARAAKSGPRPSPASPPRANRPCRPRSPPR